MPGPHPPGVVAAPLSSLPRKPSRWRLDHAIADGDTDIDATVALGGLDSGRVSIFVPEQAPDDLLKETTGQGRVTSVHPLHWIITTASLMGSVPEASGATASLSVAAAASLQSRGGSPPPLGLPTSDSPTRTGQT